MKEPLDLDHLLSEITFLGALIDFLLTTTPNHGPGSASCPFERRSHPSDRSIDRSIDRPRCHHHHSRGGGDLQSFHLRVSPSSSSEPGGLEGGSCQGTCRLGSGYCYFYYAAPRSHGRPTGLRTPREAAVGVRVVGVVPNQRPPINQSKPGVTELG